jgi:hypothetical protein
MNWDIKKYKLLCSSCNVILKNFSSDLLFLSNGTFYIINEHDQFLKKYNILSSNFFFFKILINFFFNFSKAIIFLILLIFSIKKKSNSKITKKKKYLFISHIQNNEQLKSKKDFYFSFLSNKIDTVKTCFFYLDHRKSFNSSNKFFFLNKKLDLFNELKIFVKIFKNSLKLIRIIINKNHYDKKILLMALSENFSLSHFQNLRIYQNILFILNNHKFEKIIITFEGHSYERLILKAASNFKNLRKYVYTHTIISKYQNSIKNFYSNETIPDTILLPGKVNFNFFKKYLKNKIPFDIIGSSRYIKKNSIIFNEKKACLVLPDGYEDEVIFFYNYCSKILAMSEEFKFIFRLHPRFQDKKLSIQKKFRNNKNLIFSNNLDITDDFKSSNIFLYRGSTSAVQAARFGLLPIYIKKSKTISFNIMHDFENIYPQCSSPQQFIKILSNIKTSKYSNDFTDNYFSNIKENTIRKHFCKNE